MKKLILLMLLAMVPFLTMAQKRTKKGKDIKTETTDKSSDEKATFMILKGVEIDMFEIFMISSDEGVFFKLENIFHKYMNMIFINDS